MLSNESTGDRMTKATTVAETLNHAGSEAVIVTVQTSIKEVAVALAAQPSVRVISVVDESGKLVGLIRATALCDDLFFHIAPEEFIADILDPGRLEESRRYSHAQTARDLMEPPVAVTGSDTLAQAFGRLHEDGLDGVPVVDAEGRPIAYLDRLRLIVVWLETHPDTAAPRT